MHLRTFSNIIENMCNIPEIHASRDVHFEDGNLLASENIHKESF